MKSRRDASLPPRLHHTAAPTPRCSPPNRERPAANHASQPACLAHRWLAEPLQIRVRVQVMVTSGYQGGGSDFWNRSTAVCGGRLFAGACKRHEAAADRVPAASTQRNRGRRKGCGRARAGRGGWPGGAGQAVWVSWKRWPWRPDARGIRSSAPASGPRAEPSPSPRRSPWRTACPPCPPAARPLAPS